MIARHLTTADSLERIVVDFEMSIMKNQSYDNKQNNFNMVKHNLWYSGDQEF
jgi:hypothetical protein